MPFTSLQKLIPGAAIKHGIVKEFKAIQACSAFNSQIQLFFPESKAQKEALKVIKAKSYKAGVLTVKVPNSMWASEILMRSQQIIEKVNAKLPKQKGSPVVKEIRTSSN